MFSLSLMLLLLSPVLCKNKMKTQAPAPLNTPVPTESTNITSSVAPVDQELDLPSPSLLSSIYNTVLSVLESPWSDSESASRQGGGGAMNNGIRITLGAFFATLLATIFGVVGFGSVGLLAAKALAVGTLALFLTALGALKKHHKEESSGQTVHYVPIQHGHHHEFFHERNDLLPPYLDRNV